MNRGCFLLALAVILLALWFVGIGVQVGGGLVHFLLAMAVLVYVLDWIPHSSSGPG
ncbi:MAG: DUF5670 family protein [Armatimonadota bacterium]